MIKNRISIFLATFLIVSFMFLALYGVSAQAQIELVTNGNFETGDFAGWTVMNEAGGDGNWFVYMGDTCPRCGTILPPPDGTFAAVTGQRSPGSHVLFQDIDIPAGNTTTCSVIVYYENRAGVGFINGPDLSFNRPPDNQQARIDIMDPDAPDFGIGAGVLENLFQTNPGDPNLLGYTTVNFDLTDFAGTTVRFRAAEVDNRGVFNFSIDDVTCEAIPPAMVPTLSEWGLIAMAGILGIVGFMVIRRRKATV